MTLEQVRLLVFDGHLAEGVACGQAVQHAAEQVTLCWQRNWESLSLEAVREMGREIVLVAREG